MGGSKGVYARDRANARQLQLVNRQAAVTRAAVKAAELERIELKKLKVFIEQTDHIFDAIIRLIHEMEQINGELVKRRQPEKSFWRWRIRLPKIEVVQ